MPAGITSSSSPQIVSAPVMTTKSWRADKSFRLCVVLRVTAFQHRGWAVQGPPMHDVLEQSVGREPEDDDAARYDPPAGVSIETEGQKCQRGGQVAEHRDPVIGRTVHHPIQGTGQNSPEPSGHQSTHCIPIRRHNIWRHCQVNEDRA
jgi:hypothetical protein